MLHQLVAEQPHWAARGEYLSRLLCLNPPKLCIIIIVTFFFLRLSAFRNSWNSNFSYILILIRCKMKSELALQLIFSAALYDAKERNFLPERFINVSEGGRGSDLCATPTRFALSLMRRHTQPIAHRARRLRLPGRNAVRAYSLQRREVMSRVTLLNGRSRCCGL